MRTHSPHSESFAAPAAAAGKIEIVHGQGGQAKLVL
jgi:hypothetical protein